MKKRLLLFFTIIAAVASTAFADLKFRNHRFDAFKPLPVTNEDIVFVGNSITNMNEWWEWFGSDSRIKNRGNSGGMAIEWNHEFESVLKGKPAKLFLMIGTNEIGSEAPAVVANKVRVLIERCKAESPTTELYVQSILPSTNGGRTLANIQTANTLIEQYCTEQGATYIDLYSHLGDINNGVAGDCTTMSFDHLHLTAKGYQVWTNVIKDYIGIDPIFSDTEELTLQADGFTNSYGMRLTYFSVLPVGNDDILFIGDEMVHGGEWKDYLRCPYVKNRGNGWAEHQGMTMAEHLSQLPLILHDGATPRAIILNLGSQENYGTSSWNSLGGNEGYVNKYREYIAKVKELSPNTHIFVTTFQPLQHDHNTNLLNPANQALNEMIDDLMSSDEKIHKIDLYNALIDSNTGGIKTDYYIGSTYLMSGRGYTAAANAIGSALKAVFPDLECSPVTMEEAEEQIAVYESRSTLGSAISDKLLNIKEGTGLGDQTAESLDEVYNLITEGYVLLRNDAAAAELTAKAEALNAIDLNTLTVGGFIHGAPTEEGWYNIAVYQGSPVDNGYPYVMNADASYYQKAGFQYALRYIETETEAAGKYLIHIKPGSNVEVYGLNGHYVTHQGVEKVDIPTGFTINDNRPGHWSLYKDSGMTIPYVGGSSGDGTIRYIYKKADLSGFDMYKVEIYGATCSSSEAYLQPAVTLTSAVNLGISTVHHNGYFVVTPGTKLTADMLTMSNVTNTNTPVIIIDEARKRILIDYAQNETSHFAMFEVSSRDEIEEGWYKLKNVAGQHVGKYVLNTNNEKQQDQGTNWYPMKFADFDDTHGAAAYFYFRPNAAHDHLNVQSINGHVLNNNCTAALTNDNFAVAIGDGFTLGGYWSDYSVAGEAESPFVGQSSNGSGNHYAISKVDTQLELSLFDIYHISIVGAPVPSNAGMVGQYARVTLNSQENKGIASVFDNGYFFVAAGTAVDAEMFVPDRYDGKKTTVTVGTKGEDGMIPVTVTYSDAAGITLSEPTEAQTLSKGDELVISGVYDPDDAHADGTFNVEGVDGIATIGDPDINPEAKTWAITLTINEATVTPASMEVVYSSANEDVADLTFGPISITVFPNVETVTMTVTPESGQDFAAMAIGDTIAAPKVVPDAINPRAATEIIITPETAAEVDETTGKITILTSGIFTIKAVVTNPNGVTAESAEQTITVLPNVETVTMTVTPEAGQDFTAMSIGDTIAAPKVVPDAINPRAETEIIITPETAAEVDETTGKIIILASGDFTIKAVVTNPNGDTAESAEQTITVLPNAETAAVAFADGITAPALADKVKFDVTTVPAGTNATHILSFTPEDAVVGPDTDGAYTIVKVGEITVNAIVTNPNNGPAIAVTPLTFTVAAPEITLNGETLADGDTLTIVRSIVAPAVIEAAGYDVDVTPSAGLTLADGSLTVDDTTTEGSLTITLTKDAASYTATLIVAVEEPGVEITEELAELIEAIEEGEAESLIEEIMAELEASLEEGQELPDVVAADLKGTIELDLLDDATEENVVIALDIKPNFEIEETFTEISSSNPGVAIIIDEATKTIRTIGEGKTLITIKVWRKRVAAAAFSLLSRADDDEKGEPDAVSHYWLTVTDNATLSFSADRISVEVKKSSAVTIQGNPEGYEWSVADPDIAAISIEGNTLTVAGLATGRTFITGTKGTRSVSLEVAVFAYSGIDAINADAAEGRAAIYDLSGRRLREVTRPGLYIVNGEKVFVK